MPCLKRQCTGLSGNARFPTPFTTIVPAASRCRSYIGGRNRRSGPPDRRHFVRKGPSWRAPTPLCWAPASSAPRSRCISPSAGFRVALVDKGAPGEGTSYGNAGVIEGNTLLPHPFPTSFGAVLRVALKRATEANYHLSFLPQIAPWLLEYRANSTIERRIRFANLMRPLFARALAEHEALMLESGATRYLRKEGWLKVYRSEAAFAATARERELAAEFGLPYDALDRDGALALEPALAPQFVNGVHWTQRRERDQSAGADARLYRALHRARRRRADRRCAHAASRRRPLAGRDRRRPGRCARGGGRARALGDRSARADGHRSAARGQARLSPAFPSARQCRPDAAGGRRRSRLLRRADGAGAAPHHRRGIRRPRRAADAGAVRPAAAAGARAVSARRAGRGAAVDGQPAVLCRLDAGDRPRARPDRTCGSPTAMPIGA